MIRVLYFRGCPNRTAAIALAGDVAVQADQPLSVELTEVATLEQAEELHFLGSPTIQVNGTDIEPGADGSRPVEFACRIYHTEEGTVGVPPREWLENALRAAGIEVASASPPVVAHGGGEDCCET